MLPQRADDDTGVVADSTESTEARPSVRETLEAAMAEAAAPPTVESDTHASASPRSPVEPATSSGDSNAERQALPVPAQPAPEHWSQADKETYAKLPPDWQRWTLEQRKTADAVAPLLQAIEGAKPYLQSRGTDVTTAVKSLLSAE